MYLTTAVRRRTGVFAAQEGGGTFPLCSRAVSADGAVCRTRAAGEKSCFGIPAPDIVRLTGSHPKQLFSVMDTIDRQANTRVLLSIVCSAFHARPKYAHTSSKPLAICRYALRAFPCLAAFLLRQNCAAPVGDEFFVRFLAFGGTSGLAPAKPKRTKNAKKTRRQAVVPLSIDGRIVDAPASDLGSI